MIPAMTTVIQETDTDEYVIDTSTCVGSARHSFGDRGHATIAFVVHLFMVRQQLSQKAFK
jgi:hypothetical protein